MRSVPVHGQCMCNLHKGHQIPGPKALNALGKGNMLYQKAAAFIAPEFHSPRVDGYMKVCQACYLRLFRNIVCYHPDCESRVHGVSKSRVMSMGEWLEALSDGKEITSIFRHNRRRCQTNPTPWGNATPNSGAVDEDLSDEYDGGDHDEQQDPPGIHRLDEDPRPDDMPRMDTLQSFQELSGLTDRELEFIRWKFKFHITDLAFTDLMKISDAGTEPPIDQVLCRVHMFRPFAGDDLLDFWVFNEYYVLNAPSNLDSE